MLSKKDKRNYIVLLTDERFPEKVNRRFADKTIEKLKSSLETIQTIIKDTYDKDYGLYRVLFDEYLEYHFDVSDGKSWKIGNSIDALNELQETLATHDDDICTKEEVTTLEDLGYRLMVWDKTMYIFEKQIKESDEEDIVEEVLRLKNNPIKRRIRTTLWDKTSFGKSSRSIRYKQIRLNKKLENAFLNSVKEHENRNNRSY